MPQEITRTQIEKYTVYTGPTAESFSPIMAEIYTLSLHDALPISISLLPAPTTTTIQTKLIPGPRSGSMSAAVWYSIFSPITA